ncbi:GIN domain-containing protein [Thermophagus sp. OGC60D27]|uniref:GIN domain-containing protein n=1 Tax=Thermophagus sp. OGC60D27 TaxID=3458415 RepID=UPI004037B391
MSKESKNKTTKFKVVRKDLINRLFISLTPLITLILGACDYTDALSKTGEITTKKFSVDAFDQVIIETSVQLVLANDTIMSAKAEGLDFILPRLELNQDGKTLIIESKGAIGFRKEQMPRLLLSAPNKLLITSNFPAEISTLDTLSIEQLSILVNGRGTFTQCNMLVNAEMISISIYGSNVGNHIFKGKADKLHVVAEGLSSVNASAMETKEVKYIQRSVNNSYVKAEEQLYVEIASSGNLYYYGSPDTTIIKGETLYEVDLGRVIHAD